MFGAKHQTPNPTKHSTGRLFRWSHLNGMQSYSMNSKCCKTTRVKYTFQISSLQQIECEAAHFTPRTLHNRYSCNYHVQVDHIHTPDSEDCHKHQLTVCPLENGKAAPHLLLSKPFPASADAPAWKHRMPYAMHLPNLQHLR